MDRINKLCAFLDPCESFADIGCDHGYSTEYMLTNGLCKTAIAADISFKCLEKTTKLLKGFLESGRLTAVCCDGLEKIPRDIEQVLIAGMGGEEITGILSRAFIPQKFVLQPMHNARTVREYLIASGAKITRDTVFKSGDKYYFVIKGQREGGTQGYTGAMLEYGGELTSPVLEEYLREELSKKRGYLSHCISAAGRDKILNEIKIIQGILCNETM